MCVAGLTGTSQYDGAGMILELAFSGTSVSHPALIDASAYGGIEFWLWVSPSTAASVGPSFLVQLFDKNQIPEGGVCDANDSGVKACAAAMAGLSGSPAAEARRAGTLYTDDGSELRLLAGGCPRSMEQSRSKSVVGRGERADSRSANSGGDELPRLTRQRERACGPLRLLHLPAELPSQV
jgi:hypothetical protein